MENRPNSRATCNSTSSCIEKCCIPTNAAKCRDPKDTDVMGTLECGAAFVNRCPDSLGPTYLRVKNKYDERNKKWFCTKWYNKAALKGTVVTVVEEKTETQKKEKPKGNRKGKTRSPEEIERASEERIQKRLDLPKDQQMRYIIQKAIAAHPNMAPPNVGVLAMKRLHCDGYGCSVFKSSICIQCPKKCKGQKRWGGANGKAAKRLGYFHTISSNVKEKDTTKFLKYCAQLAFNNSTQELLPEFECTGLAREKATYYMASF